MKEKKIEFEDDGVLIVRIVDGGELYVHLQARHLGQGQKFTSAGVVMDAEKSRELLDWLAVNLSKEDPSS